MYGWFLLRRAKSLVIARRMVDVEKAKLYSHEQFCQRTGCRIGALSKRQHHAPLLRARALLLLWVCSVERRAAYPVGLAAKFSPGDFVCNMQQYSCSCGILGARPRPPRERSLPYVPPEDPLLTACPTMPGRGAFLLVSVS